MNSSPVTRTKTRIFHNSLVFVTGLEFETVKKFLSQFYKCKDNSKLTQ